MKLKYFFFYIFFLPITMGIAQDYQVNRDIQTKFTQITTKDGLSNNRVMDIMQDRYGFVWMATADGLNRYDGNDFLVFKNIPGDTTSISANLITSMTEDIYGNFWVGTIFGLNKFDRTQNTFIHYFYDSKDENTIRNDHIRALLADEKGLLWIETVDGYLHKMNIRTGSMQYYKHAPVNQIYYHYHSIFKENDSIIWLGGRNQDIHQFNINTSKFKIYPASENGYSSGKRANDVSCIFKDSRGQLWVCGLDGSYQYLKEEDRFELFLKGSNFDIFEDEKQHLWFGSGNGIYKFNPYSDEISHITANVNNPNSLIHNHINKIMGDMSGVIWVATNEGISLYSPKKSNFKHYVHIPDENQSISGRRVTALAEDKNGKLWVGTANEGLNSLDLETNTIQKYKAEKKKGSSLVSNQISHLYFDSNDDLWISQWSGRGFNKLNPKTGIFQSYVLHKENSYFDWYHQIVENDKGDMLLAVWGGCGLYGMKDKKKQLQHIGRDLEIIPNEKCVTTIHLESDSILWLGGYHSQVNALIKGRWVYYKNLFGHNRPSYQELMALQENHYTNLSVPDFDTIHQILQLKNQSYFLHQKGLFAYDSKLRDFHQDFPEELLSKAILSLAKDEDHLYVLHPESISIFNSKTAIWELCPLKLHLSKKAQLLVDSSTIWLSNKNEIFELDRAFQVIASSLYDQNIIQPQVHEEGGIVFAMGQQIIIKQKTKDDQKIHLEREPLDFAIKGEQLYILTEHMLWNARINGSAPLKLSALIDHDNCNIDPHRMSFHELQIKGHLLYMAGNRGYLAYDIDRKKAHFRRKKERDFLEYPVHLLTAICQGEGDDYWLGTTSTGLAKWDSRANTLLNYPSNRYAKDAFWGHTVNFIFKDSQNRIWIGSEGLNLHQDSTDVFAHFTIEDGLPTNKLYGMTEDDKGRFWISSSKGLSCFSFPERTFINYTEADGLPDNELSSAIIKLTDGRIALGSRNGFSVFHPDSLMANYYIPPVVITEMQIQDFQVFHDLSEMDSIILQPHENHLTFRFASLDYNSPQDNKYRYQLEGVDEEFIETDATNRAISYSNLKAGSYYFKLQGSNNNEIWNEHGKSLYIKILPHYYQQWWFYLLVFVFVAFVIVMIVIYRIRELNLQNKAASLEQRFLRSQMNPHFIFNSLGAIQNFIFKNEPIVAATYLSNFSDLVRMILNNSRQDLIPLQEEIKTLNQYLDLQKLRFGDKFEYQLKIGDHLDNENLLVPPMLAQPFIENSIEHGFSGMKEKGLIHLSYHKRGVYLEMIIDDNGLGIEASLKKKKDAQKKHKSLATKITRDRIKVINKVHHSNIQLEIIDLKNLDVDNQGTRVRILIPINLKNKQKEL